jgi:hypothetical protein
MKYLLLLLALSANAQIIHIPPGSKSNATPWWVSYPTTNSIVGWEAWQTAETNFTYIQSSLDRISRKVGTNDDGRVIQSTPTWQDESMPMVNLTSPQRQPGRVAFIGGIYLYGFDDNSLEELQGTLQNKHSGQGSNTVLYLHGHDSPMNAPAANASNCVWGFEYAVANTFAAFPTNTTTVYITNSYASKRQHSLFSIVAISNLVDSAGVVFRFFRDGANASDTQVGDVVPLFLDAHWVWSSGSTNQFGE